ncbi:unnamed protein product [Urochloa decumbens]|uniref:DUF4220 domain-containing protein n=1 Tax=Urochloa decumbens TaxID=240449 RepID=A0ABC9BXM2_9POAL
MENLVQLFYDWEIQQLVLLSFTIQIFLFFTGGLRRRGTNILLRFSIWIAYLGADMVAVYSLGYLSRHADAHPLAFFWAPFLLVHLGGQDTITAFAMEDNSLWLRHLLNLVVQAVLAVYVFWKSIGRHDVELLVSGTIVFIVGIIRYGERIWSLRCGRYESLEESPGNQYELQMNDSRQRGETFKHSPVQEEITIDQNTDYYNTVCLGLRSMPTVFSVFVSRTSEIFNNVPVDTTFYFGDRLDGVKKKLKLLEICLGIMYGDLYTKALVLRTRSGIILRCISHICAWVAFIVFLACHGGRYSRVDISITYLLFIGGLSLEVCGMTNLMASPWTWAWLKARKHEKLAWFCWYLFSSNLIGWPEKKRLWSNEMGQYNFYGWLGRNEQQQPSSFNQQCMAAVRQLAALFGVEKMKLLWMSKLLEREHVKVDGVLIKCLLDRIGLLDSPKALPNLGPHLNLMGSTFDMVTIVLHVLTEKHLSKYSPSDLEGNEAAAYTNGLVEDCRKLSRYMMYLMVASPSLLPLEQSSVAVLERWQQSRWGSGCTELAEWIADALQPGQETLEEIKELWVQLIIYAASKSRPENHAAQLARGGELLTFVWLQLAFYGLIGSNRARIELTNKSSKAKIFYAMHSPPEDLVTT